LLWPLGFKSSLFLFFIKLSWPFFLYVDDRLFYGFCNFLLQTVKIVWSTVITLNISPFMIIHGYIYIYIYIYISYKEKNLYRTVCWKMFVFQGKMPYFILLVFLQRKIFWSPPSTLIKWLFYLIFVIGSVSLTKIDAIV
jgi:hypothetical protein